MDTDVSLDALQALQNLESNHQNLGVPVNRSQEIPVTLQLSTLDLPIQSQQRTDVSSLSAPENGSKRKRKDDGTPSSRKRKTLSNSGQSENAIPENSLVNFAAAVNNSNSLPHTNIPPSTLPGQGASPFGIVIYKPNSSFPIMNSASGLQSNNQDQWATIIQAQIQNAENMKNLKEAHLRTLSISSSNLQLSSALNTLSESSSTLAPEESTQNAQPLLPSIQLYLPQMLPTQATIASKTSRFMLLDQPNPRQRKSYKNENRYLLPNPLTIIPREVSPDENLPPIVEGRVTVQLVTAGGEEVQRTILESPENGGVVTLESSMKARFPLKISETSEGAMYRLLFTIQYRVANSNNSTIEEKVLSDPFQVTANVKKNSKQRVREVPLVYDMRPREGLVHQDTEVWIKGQGFHDKALVAFGDRFGRVLEVTNNLITVLAPGRPDYGTGTTVSVVVSNKYGDDIISSDKLMPFLYL